MRMDSLAAGALVAVLVRGTGGVRGMLWPGVLCLAAAGSLLLVLMAHARGVICLAARQRSIAVMTLPPATVKRAIAASGAASKEQVQVCVQRLLKLARPPGPSHVADALGLAASGMSRITGRLPGRAHEWAGTSGLSAGRRITGRGGECGGHLGAPADEEKPPVAPSPPAAPTRRGSGGRA